MTGHPEKPPFQDHRRYYLFLKLAVVILAAWFAARYILSLPMMP